MISIFPLSCFSCLSWSLLVLPLVSLFLDTLLRLEQPAGVVHRLLLLLRGHARFRRRPRRRRGRPRQRLAGARRRGRRRLALEAPRRPLALQLLADPLLAGPQPVEELR